MKKELKLLFIPNSLLIVTPVIIELTMKIYKYLKIIRRKHYENIHK